MYIIIERSSFPIDFSALREIEKERKRGLGVLRRVIYVSGKGKVFAYAVGCERW